MGKFKDIKARTITGIVFISILIAAIVINQYTFFAVFLVINIIASYEFFKINFKEKLRNILIVNVIISAIIFTINFFVASGIIGNQNLLLIIPIIVVMFSVQLFIKNANNIYNLATSLLGIIYISIPLSLLNYIVFYNKNYNYKIILALFIIIWTYDTFAYIWGSWLGKHRICERLSPKKSWEGAIFSTITTIFASIIIAYFYKELTLINWVIFTVLVIIFATIGDLFESLIKRNLNIKDTGTILPGHGGILDRIDALLITSAVILFFLEYFVRK